LTKSSVEILEQKIEKEKIKEYEEYNCYDEMCDLWPTGLKKN